MQEPVDIYCDQFQLTASPYGAILNFMVTPPVPPSPGVIPQGTRLATVRMSLEHLKVLAFILRTHLMQYEQTTGVNVQVPIEVLNSLRIGHEDWDTFWKRA